MRNRKCGPARNEAFNRFLNLLLCLGIHRCRGFIQNQNPRVMQNRTSNRYPLTLAARKPRASLPNLRIVAISETHD